MTRQSKENRSSNPISNIGEPSPEIREVCRKEAEEATKRYVDHQLREMFSHRQNRKFGAGIVVEKQVWWKHGDTAWWYYGLPVRYELRQYAVYHYCWSSVLGEPVKIIVEKSLSYKQVVRQQIGMSY